jgi:hypothetical protein
MDFLNSQQLTALDGYFHKFLADGDYRWGIGAVGTYTIHVKPKDPVHIPQQLTITLTYDRSGAYQPDQPQVEIYQNDWILWHAPNAAFSVPPYSILGSGSANFNSRALGVGDMFSHIFVQNGTYRYMVGGGTGGPQNGSIQVDPAPVPPPHAAKNVNVIDAAPPKPDPVQIVSGDTIVWVINKGSSFVINSAQ